MAKIELATIDASQKDDLLAKTKEELTLMVKGVESQIATLQTTRRNLLLLINFKAAFEVAEVITPIVTPDP